MSNDAAKRRKAYKAALYDAQVQLVKLQKHVIETGRQVLVIFEGRDAAGKDGTIKRIVQHLSPRETRVVALGKPSDRDLKSWYFQRYVLHLPVAGELVLFNRSWYNRAGVERVLGFCSEEQYEEFMRTVPLFEQLLAHCGITLIKYYLDISKDEQARRLKARKKSPLHPWKLSGLDIEGAKHWKEYSTARNEMFARTHGVFAPWIVVRADDKKVARVNVIRDCLSRFEFDGKDPAVALADPDVVFPYHEASLTNGMIAR
jgi:polyphosphate kinase 2